MRDLGDGLYLEVLGGGGAAYDPINDGIQNVWAPYLGYTGTTSSLTDCPNFGAGSSVLTYSGGSPATVVDLNGTPAIYMPGGTTNSILKAPDAAAELGAGGANQPYTIGLVFRMATKKDTYAWQLDSTAVANGYETLRLRNAAGDMGMFSKDSANATNFPLLAEANEADRTYAILAVVRADNTVDVWCNDVLSVDAAAYVRSGLFAAMESLAFGGFYVGAGNPAFEIDGWFQYMLFHPAEISRERGDKIAHFMAGF